jgi:cell division ATPase FtsA
MAIIQGVDRGATKTRKITIRGGWGNIKNAHSSKPQKKVLLAPSQMLTYRRLSFPFQDKKRILEVLPGELGENIIIPMDKAVWGVSSFSPLGVNTLVTSKDSLYSLVSSASDNGFDVIDGEPNALFRVARFNKIDDVLIIDLGASKTTFLGIKNGKINALRVRMAGGERIDNLVAISRSISIEEAQALKMEYGIHERVIQRIITDILKSTLLFEEFDYDRVILTGGGSLMPGIVDFIKEKAQNENVDFFKLPDGFNPHFDASAFGAALYDTIKDERINLKQDSAKAKSISWLWVLFFLIPLIIYSVNIKIEDNLVKGENLRLKTAMAAVIKQEIPDIKTIVAPVTQLEAEVNKLKGASGGQSVEVLKLFSSISKSKANLPLLLYEMDLSPDSIKITGESDSFKEVEQFNKNLQQDMGQAEVVEQNSKPSGKKNFVIKITLNGETAVKTPPKEGEKVGPGEK